MSSSTTMPFGKHRGKQLAAVPADYLLWALNHATLNWGLALDIRNELQRRQDVARGQEHSRTGYALQRHQMPAGVTIAQVLELVQAGRRSLARKHHPDAGGNTATMQAVNVASDWLLEALPDLLEVRR